MSTGIVQSYGALGSAGSWSHAAGTQRYPNAERIGRTTFDEVAAALSNKECDVALFPIRNSLTGDIPRVASIISDHGFSIIDELSLPIHHCLISAPNTSLDDFSDRAALKIFSHPQGFLQCKKFLAAHFPSAELVEMTDTASGIKHVAEGGDSAGLSIGSAFAAGIYQGTILNAAINDDPDNLTTFAICRRQDAD